MSMQEAAIPDGISEKAFLESGAHLAFRRTLSPARWREISASIQDPARPLEDRAALRLKLFLEEETIVQRPGEVIPAWRTIPAFPDIYAEGEKERLTEGKYVHEQGRVCNISSDWDGALRGGLLARKGANHAQNLCVDAVIAYADRYGDGDLSYAVRYGARGYLEALRLLRVLHFCLWASNVYHNTLGRFDQYMYPYYRQDMDAGNLTEAEALAYTEALFLSFNRDSDLYPGMQQGDNGQSLMLGGCDARGRPAVNDLTALCLTASLNNRRIDPKINLRVDKNTPLALYERCTELTKQGLGFPQYANDDVVIPALIKMGYAPEDARDYTVAACWEFIIPAVAMDIPNIGAVSLPEAVRDAMLSHLTVSDDFDALFARVRENLFARADAIEAEVTPLFMEPAPYQTVLMRGCGGRDISEGLRYNHYGIHGVGVASAADALAAVKRYVFDEPRVQKDALLQALRDDFDGALPLKRLLRFDAPKLGRDDSAQEIADRLLHAFADSWAGRVNERGGIFRPGTGSAMYYLWFARDLGATADGRSAGEMLSANFSPSLLLTDAGPLSAIRAMAAAPVSRAINGGPLTLELHDTVFRTAEGLQKVAQLVRSYIGLGGHQLQLNAVSRETLLDAQAHPDAHRNLIVRVWGWSGHFIQLDQAYQNQIIERTSYKM